eukprot:Protomagalhaensia_wolfi_Nauph_80__5512@NODE_604_length_2222_cov_20_811269_g452_i0_p2_GENE_NODE_604_length_2222_cov_20_811269_g452_i0NODE_604_length_2222_cov_20_811269_g452_i0_p2_ORF_typecomplete_len187_score37_00Ins_beta/PF03488_14/0_1_NODE_604_length_2222_cov_20_811269_g452_i011781738
MRVALCDPALVEALTDVNNKEHTPTTFWKQYNCEAAPDVEYRGDLEDLYDQAKWLCQELKRHGAVFELGVEDFWKLDIPLGVSTDPHFNSVIDEELEDIEAGWEFYDRVCSLLSAHTSQLLQKASNLLLKVCGTSCNNIDKVKLSPSCFKWKPGDPDTVQTDQVYFLVAGQTAILYRFGSDCRAQW